MSSLRNAVSASGRSRPESGAIARGRGPEKRVRVGLGDDREARAFDHLAGIELEVDPGARALAAEEDLERGGDVQRVRETTLQLAVAFDAPDHGGVETDAGVEEERPAIRTADADAFGRAARERPQ